MLKFIFSLLLSFLILINFSYAEKIKEIKISGNSRISDETIRVFSDLDLSQNYEDINLNNLIKELYETNYFSDVSIKYENQISKYCSFIKIRKVSQNQNTTNLDIDDVDRILDKLKTDGWDGLSEHEKSTLFQASKKRRQDNHLN